MSINRSVLQDWKRISNSVNITSLFNAKKKERKNRFRLTLYTSTFRTNCYIRWLKMQGLKRYVNVLKDIFNYSLMTHKTVKSSSYYHYSQSSNQVVDAAHMHFTRCDILIKALRDILFSIQLSTAGLYPTRAPVAGSLVKPCCDVSWVLDPFNNPFQFCKGERTKIPPKWEQSERLMQHTEKIIPLSYCY